MPSTELHLVDELDELVRSPRWRDAAACRDEDPELFFPVGQGTLYRLQVADAKAVCALCPARARCLQEALDGGIDDGVFGGLDADERRALKRGERRQRPLTGLSKAAAIRAALEALGDVEIPAVLAWLARSGVTVSRDYACTVRAQWARAKELNGAAVDRDEVNQANVESWLLGLLVELNGAEKRVVARRLFAAGSSRTAISNVLHVSGSTVNSYLSGMDGRVRASAKPAQTSKNTDIQTVRRAAS